MTLGFCGSFGRANSSIESTKGRFAVRGSEKQVTIRTGAFLLTVTLVERERQVESIHPVFVCGHIANGLAVVRLLVERGFAPTPDASNLEWLRLLYQAYGVEGFGLLEGLFAGAMLVEERLVLFTGKTPGPSLYYSIDADRGGTTFTTELKAMPERLRRLLPFRELLRASSTDRARQTCLESVVRVPSGHCVEIDLLEDRVAFEETAYYTVHRSITLTDENTAAVQLRESIVNAVLTFPGNQANCLISGGLDSSIVAYLAKQRFASLNLFSLGSRSHNEFDKAEIFARSIGLPFERVLIDEEEFLVALPQLVYLVEHCYGTFIEYLVPVHIAHSHIGNTADILLSGYGSDVLFAGFARTGNTLRDVARLVRTEYQSTIWSNEASQVLGGVIGAEVGYPFFDSQVVDVSFSIDPFLKHKNGVEKYILRKAFAGQIADDVLFRPKLGIHQGTGCEAYFTKFVRDESLGEPNRVTKDRLCYEILCQTLVHGREPQDLDMLEIRREAARRARDELEREPALANVVVVV